MAWGTKGEVIGRNRFYVLRARKLNFECDPKTEIVPFVRIDYNPSSLNFKALMASVMSWVGGRKHRLN